MAEKQVTIKLNIAPGDTGSMTASFAKATSQLNQQLSGAFGNAFGNTFQQSLQQKMGQINLGPLHGSLNQMFGGIGGGNATLGAGRVAGAGLIGMQAGGIVGGPVGSAMSSVGQAVAQGAAGFAAGGPIGAAIALIPIAIQKIKDLASLPFNIMASGFSALSTGMKDLGGQLGAGGALLSGTRALVEKIPLVGEAMGRMTGAFRDFLETGVGMVKLFSPGAQGRFEIAQTDAMAVIGRTMTPVLEALTEFTRLIGDFLATVLPGIGEMRTMLSPLRDLFADLRQDLADLAPIFREVIVVHIRGFITILTALARAIELPMRGLATLLGIQGTGTLSNSVGMAARSISFMSPDAAAKEVYQAAFRSGVPPEKTIQSDVSRIRDIIEIWSTVLTPLGIATALRDFATGGGPGAAAAAADPAREAIRGAR